MKGESGRGRPPQAYDDYEPFPLGAGQLGDRTAITCVLADDHPAILDSIGRHLTASGYSLVGAVSDGVQALETVVALRPIVCVADVRMPKLDGLELSRELVRRGVETGVLLYSGVSDQGLVSDALDAGARGFALKDAPLTDLSRAIDTVAAGSIYIDPVLAAQLASNRGTSGHKPLSEREREVIRLLAEGGSYAEIGASLFLSPDTVRAHAQRAMTKLGAHTRTQAVAIALRDGIVS